MLRFRLERLEERIVWILGGPRTGSTWLMELLVYPLGAGEASDSGVVRRPGGSGVRPRALPINEPYLGIHLAPRAGAGPNALPAAEARAGDASYFFDDRYADVWRPELRQLVLKRFGAQAARARKEHGLEDDPLVVVKEPNGSEAAPILTSTLPRSRLLFLLRDGRDVLDSLLDAVGPGGWLDRGLDSSEGRLEFLRSSAAAWVHRTTEVQRAAEAHPAELTRTVRYEDLRADAGPPLRGIWEWLGVDPGEAALEEAVAATSFDDYPAEAKGRGKPLRLASPGHWREAFSADEQRAVAEIMGPKLEELGYPA